MTVAHYRINELDAADRVVDGYSVMCRSDTAALAMASKGAENRAAAVEVWEDTRHVARLDPVSPWHRLRSQWAGLPADDRFVADKLAKIGRSAKIDGPAAQVEENRLPPRGGAASIPQGGSRAQQWDADATQPDGRGSGWCGLPSRTDPAPLRWRPMRGSSP
jgi:hypothetical protein